MCSRPTSTVPRRVRQIGLLSLGSAGLRGPSYSFRYPVSDIRNVQSDILQIRMTFGAPNSASLSNVLEFLRFLQLQAASLALPPKDQKKTSPLPLHIRIVPEQELAASGGKKAETEPVRKRDQPRRHASKSYQH